MEHLTLNTLVILGTYLVSMVGIYWKMKLDIARIDLEIGNITCDRKEKWAEHDERRDKTEAYLSDIQKNVQKTDKNIGVIMTHIEYLRKNKE